MKKVLKTIIEFLLLVAFFATFKNIPSSAFAISWETQKVMFVLANVLPNVISLFAIGYCLYRLSQKDNTLTK